MSTPKYCIGLPQMHLEPGERRVFLPEFVHYMEKLGAEIVLENGYGSGLGLSEDDYLEKTSHTRFAELEEVYQQDFVLVLRYPGDDMIKTMRIGACLVSMLHYPTRPQRVALLNQRGLRGVSLDSIKDETGRRLVENLASVAWNGMHVSFNALEKVYPPPGLYSPQRSPVQVTLLGAGAVGKLTVQAAVSYGDLQLRERLVNAGVPGVQVTVIDYDLTNHAGPMREILSKTDILVDATQRNDASKPVIPNTWLAWLPEYAVITDLAVDPYTLDSQPPVVRGIEGIPQGNLDKYIFNPDDPDWDNTVPASIPSSHRRIVVSCYSWPGISPKACMSHYAQQLQPLMKRLITKVYEQLSPDGDYFESALYNATLKAWLKNQANKQ
jgi:alanine dehydrogenase